MRQAVARGRRRRVRGDRLPRVLRARRDRARPAAAQLLQVPGERNELRYAPRGVVAVISPWNFPLGDPVRDDLGGAGDRQRGRAQARRAVAGAAPTRSSQALRAGGVPPAAIVAAARARATSARRSCAIPSVARDRVHRLAAGRPRDRRAPRPRPRRAAALQAGGRRAGRQELRDRRRRRRPRRGGPGDRRLGVRVRRPEVLGRLAGARPRGDRRSAARAAGGRGRRAASSARRETLGTDVPPVIERAAQERVDALRELAARARARSSRARRARPTADGWFCPRRRVVADLPADSPVLSGGDLRPAAGRPARPRRRAGVRPRRRLAFALTGGLFARDPGDRPPRARAHAGRQPVRQPRDHRRDGRPPAVRRQPPVGHRA